MVEVFTIGGGEYIVNTFNVVAAWTGGGGYRSLLKVVMVLGLIYSLLAVAFTMNVRAWLNWFLGSSLIYMCLMVPTVSVKVTDRINPSLAPATVANVPLGLGVIASFTSQVGDWLTRTAETVFTMPSQLNYSTNGMIYGARLFDATRNFEIRDAEFATNLSAHFKNCVFGDIMLGRKSMTDLAAASDLWAAMGPGSAARSQPWTSRSGAMVTTDIITCNNAYDALTDQWRPMIEAHTPLWSKQAFPKLSTSIASAKLRADIPIVNQAFTASSADFENVMRQNTAINAFMQARDGMAGGPGSASIDTFATTRADIQARNTYNSIAQQAMSWVPILNIVLTVVFYAMFPVVFPLFLMPQTGVGALKGYLTGFFYLAAWGPLYVILHMICMTRATIAAKGVAEGGMSLGTYAGIGAVNAETATIAGFMLMSVPFLAAGLAKGAMSISGQATSILSPAQNAAEAAAAEQTTGNYSYGNTSFANSTSNMRQSSQWSDAPTFSSGSFGSTYRFDNGATASSYGNGFAVTDTTGAMSKLGVTPTMSTGYVSEMRQAAGMLERQAKSEEKSAADILTATHTDRNTQGRSTEFSSGSETSSGSQSNTSLERSDRRSSSTFDGVDNRAAVTQSSRTADSHNRAAETLDTTRGGFSAGIGGPSPRADGAQAPGRGGEGGPGAAQEKVPQGKEPILSRAARSLPRAELSRTWTGQQSDRLQRSEDRSRAVEDSAAATDGSRDEHAVGDNASSSDGTYTRGGVFARSSSSSSSSVSREEALSRAYSHEQRARELHEKAQQLSNDASYAESHGMQMSENMSQELAQWYAAEQARRPGLNAPGLHEVAVTDQQRQTRDTMISTFLAERRNAIYNEVAPRLRSPDLVDVSGPPVASASDVRAHYHNRGVGSAPALATAGNGSNVVARIDDGRAEVDATTSAKKANHSGSVVAASDLRGDVDTSLNKGFFKDPKLRE